MNDTIDLNASENTNRKGCLEFVVRAKTDVNHPIDTFVVDWNFLSLRKSRATDSPPLGQKKLAR
jgi:hypothetical protein